MRRLAGLGLDVVRAALGRTVPFKLTFIVTDACSARCAVCSLWKNPRPGPTLTEIRELFRANPHLSWINLSGGDVVEHPEFNEIVAAAVTSTRVYALSFPTAGQHPAQTEQRVREALGLPLPRLLVSVSLDGPPAVHDRLRGCDGAFARAAETFRRLLPLRSRRFRVYAGFTLSSRNDRDPERLVDELLCAAPFLRRADLHFNIAHHAPHYYRNRPGDRPDPVRTAAFLNGEASRRPAAGGPFAALEAAYWRLAERYLATGASPIRCAALAASAFVDPDLMLFPCATWDRPLLDLRSVGFSLARAAAETAVARARSDASSARCPGCWTPCDAYPSMLAAPVRTAVACLSPSAPPVGSAESAEEQP